MSTYTPIATQTLSSTAATVTFSGIPQTYTDLILVCNIAQSSGANSLRYRFNDDSGSNYSATHLYGNGSTASSGRESSATSGYINTTGNTTLDAVFTLQVMDYSNITTNKTAVGRGNNASVGTDATVGLWRNTSAINKISVAMGGSFPTNNFASGSTFTLYGIGSGSPKAFGGDEVRTDGTYWYHIYRSSGIFAPVQDLSCDYLVVAGGGAGGNNGSFGSDGAGGGGAGGLRSTVTATGGGGSLESALSLTAGNNYAITVGAGGAGRTGGDGRGSAGSNSVFSTITSTGGGGGGGYTQEVGGSGGSGGGAGWYLNSASGAGTRTASPIQGYDGGNAPGGGVDGNGGGGGAGGAGQPSANGNDGGNGGLGLAVAITGSSVTYAGGGGGAGDTSAGVGGTGGSGVGGAGATTGASSAGNGVVNTGSGGGGAAAGNKTSGAGGSGIVIVRYTR